MIRVSVRGIVFLCAVAVGVIVGSEEGSRAGGLLRQAEQDDSCGPRCLWALMQLTGVGKTDCDIECIYELIGRPVASPVNLKDLRDAATKFGFRASGKTLSVAELKEIRGYAILVVGKAVGTQVNPQHFVLISGVVGDQVLIVDTRTLVIWATPLQELEKIWGGVALVIPTDALGDHLFRPPGDTTDSGVLARSERIDLGAVEVGSRIERSFVVSEVGDAADWDIIGKSCSCLEAELRRGEKGQVLLSVQFDVERAGPQASFVAVRSKATDARRDYRLHAYGKNAHRINVAVGHLEVDEGCGEYPVTIEYFPGEQQTPVTFDGIETKIANLSCGEAKVEEVPYGNMKVFRFTVPLAYTVTDASQTRTLKDTVYFKLNTSTGERFIPFEFSVRAGRPPIELTPSALFMICSRSAAKPIERKVRVIVHEEGSANEPSVKVVSPIPLHVSRQPVSKGECVLCVTVVPSDLAEMSAGMQRGEIAVTLAGEGEMDQSVTLPVCVIVRE